MDPIQIVISAVSGLCCCLFWVALLGGVVWFMMRRKGGGEGASTGAAAIEEEKDLSGLAPSTADAAPGPSEDDDPEDAATVIAPQPATVKPVEAPPKAAPPKPAPRTSGATIIAFDDDFDDEED